MAISFVFDLGTAFISPILSALDAKSSALVGLGKSLLAFAFMAEMLVELYAYLLGGGIQMFLQRMARKILVLSIPLAALMNWGWAAGAISDFGIQDLASAVGGGSQPQTVIANITGSVEKSIHNIEDAILGKPTGSEWWTETLVRIVKRLPAIIIGFFMMALFVITTIVMLLALLLGLYMPIIMLKIGFVFGPVLVAWLVFSPLADFARKWLSYMLSQAFSYAVSVMLAVVVANAVSAVFGQFSKLGINSDADLDALLAAIFLLSLGNLFVAYLLIRADNIAAAMVGGPNPGAGAEYLGSKMAGAIAGAMKGLGGAKGGDKGGDGKDGGDKGGKDDGGAGKASGVMPGPGGAPSSTPGSGPGSTSGGAPGGVNPGPASGSSGGGGGGGAMPGPGSAPGGNPGPVGAANAPASANALGGGTASTSAPAAGGGATPGTPVGGGAPNPSGAHRRVAQKAAQQGAGGSLGQGPGGGSKGPSLGGKLKAGMGGVKQWAQSPQGKASIKSAAVKMAHGLEGAAVTGAAVAAVATAGGPAAIGVGAAVLAARLKGRDITPVSSTASSIVSGTKKARDFFK